MHLFWNLSPKEQWKIAKENPDCMAIGIAIGLFISVFFFALRAFF